jgi:hypothetical protein
MKKLFLLGLFLAGSASAFQPVAEVKAQAVKVSTDKQYRLDTKLANLIKDASDNGKFSLVVSYDGVNRANLDATIKALKALGYHVEKDLNLYISWK